MSAAPLPDGSTVSTPTLPPLPSTPSLSSYLNGSNTSTPASTGASTASSVNGMTSSQITTNQTAAGSTSIWSSLGAWLKSIALPGTIALSGLLLIILSIYVAVTGHTK